MPINQKKTPYISAINNYVQQKRTPFHMPGHKQGVGINKLLKKLWGSKIFKYDLTEVDGLDYLNAPDGVITQTQNLASQAFGAEHTFFLINGSTTGNQAAILTLVKDKQKILVARNAHQSVFSGLILSGAIPVYASPTFDDQSGLYPTIGSTIVSNLLKKHSDIKTVFITSPINTGFTSNIQKISSEIKKHNIPMIVDEAHGAHFKFHPNLPSSAIDLGADLVIQSTHKTLSSLTQTSMLHLVNSKYTTHKEIQNTLFLLQSSSPNMLFLMSLDAARQQMATHGKSLLQKTLDLARYTRKEINKIPSLYCYGKEVIGKNDIFDLDETKLLIKVNETGYTGYEIEKILGNKFHIEVEMSDMTHVLCFITIGDTEKSIHKLITALKLISIKTKKRNVEKISLSKMPEIPELVLTPRDAFFAKKKMVSLSSSIGEVSGEFVMSFPPDIPIIAPGEKINKETLTYILELNKSGANIVGLKDNNSDYIEVISKNEK